MSDVRRIADTELAYLRHLDGRRRAAEEAQADYLAFLAVRYGLDAEIDRIDAAGEIARAAPPAGEA